jgi:hypothetical protein
MRIIQQHSTAQHSTAQHSTAQHSTAQHSTAQHSTAQHSTAQHSTAQHSTFRSSRQFYCLRAMDAFGLFLGASALRDSPRATANRRSGVEKLAFQRSEKFCLKQLGERSEQVRPHSNRVCQLFETQHAKFYDDS